MGLGSFAFYPLTKGDAKHAYAAGFHFSDTKRFFYTSSLQVAARLKDFADSQALTEIQRQLITIKPWDLPLPSPAGGGVLLPHQTEALRFALERNRCYLGLDPGLGKTMIAALVAGVLIYRCVYITPPFLVQNIIGEFARWSPSSKLAVYGAKVDEKKIKDADVLIIPDSLITRPGVFEVVNSFGSYNLRTMIIDEAHRYKNKDAKRTRALLGSQAAPGLVDLCQRAVYMSGTPMPNRPLELFPILKKAAPETIDFVSEFDYARKYCGAYKNRFGWDKSGASNIKELGHRVKAPTGPFMLRISKSVLNLPPKIEEVFLLTGKMGEGLVAMERLVASKYKSADDLIKQKLTALAGGADDLHIASYRRMLGTEKAKLIIPYIKSLLEETDEKIVVFAYHQEAVSTLAEGLKEFLPAVITGKTTMAERHKAVQRFQASPESRLIIGNYAAMGVGFTLTAAHREIFVEFDWVPGVNDQAADRAHRIGQTKSILVQYVVYPDSVDKSVLEALLNKREAIKLV